MPNADVPAPPDGRRDAEDAPADRLEEKGLVTRSTGKTDGRCRILRLTEKGKHFNDDFTTIVREVNEEIEHCFTREEVAQMRELLLRLAESLREATEKEDSE